MLFKYFCNNYIKIFENVKKKVKNKFKNVKSINVNRFFKKNSDVDTFLVAKILFATKKGFYLPIFYKNE